MCCCVIPHISDSLINPQIEKIGTLKIWDRQNDEFHVAIFFYKKIKNKNVKTCNKEVCALC